MKQLFQLLVCGFFLAFVTPMVAQDDAQSPTIQIDDWQHQYTQTNVPDAPIYGQSTPFANSYSADTDDWNFREQESVHEGQNTSRLLAFHFTPPPPPPDDTEAATVKQEEQTFIQSLLAWLGENWVTFVLGLLGVLKVVVNLTPTETDNKVFEWLDRIINGLIPNRKSGGGVHT